jgi:opacity protein-like surface antigen
MLVTTISSCALVLLLSFGSCRGHPVEFLVEARLLRTEIESNDDAFSREPSGTSESISPHGEVWAAGWGLILDYQESKGETGTFQRGNGVTSIDSEESALDVFVGHRLQLTADAELDLYLGARQLEIEYNFLDQRSANPFPARFQESISETEIVLGARLHHPVGPFAVQLRADAGRSGQSSSWVLGLGLSYDITEFLSSGVLVEWSGLSFDEQFLDDRRSRAVMLGLAFRF